MNEQQGNNELNEGSCSDSVCEETGKEKSNQDSTSESTNENNSHVYGNLEKENKMIELVAHENFGEIIIYEKSENSEKTTENSTEIIQVCDSGNINDFQNKEDLNVDVTGEDSAIENPEVNVNGTQGELDEKDEENIGCDGSERRLGEGSLKNYKNVILEDWEVEVPHALANHESEVIGSETQIDHGLNSQQVLTFKNENCAVVEVGEAEEKEISAETATNGENSESQKENSAAVHENVAVDKKTDCLKMPKLITKNDIVKILDESSERIVRPIVTGKDLFFSIELTKRLNQTLSLNKSAKNSESGDKKSESDPCNNNNTTVDDRQKIVDILEAEEIKDWKSVPSKSDSAAKENGNDMEISKAIKSMEEGDSNAGGRAPRRTPLKKFKIMDKELERTIALQQLREEFPSTRKRSRTTKKVNHIPFLASTVLEKALTSPEVTTALKPGPPRRRPCYAPDNVSYSKSPEKADVEEPQTVEAKAKKPKSKSEAEGTEDGRAETKLGPPGPETGKSMPNAVVKTYSAKRKSTDAESEIKSTIAAVTKALSESAEKTSESKPKKQKTVIKQENQKNKVLVKKKKKKLKVGVEGKRNLELEKLLGDEGAVRMLYDTQHGESSASAGKKSRIKTTTGLKKDLVLKTKLVKNAVMRLSGVGVEGVSLRGKRRSVKPGPEAALHEEPLFASTPNIVFYKPKKKQRAEASRILYRHSSSESFDSSEGYRRTSFDAEGSSVSCKEGLVDGSSDLNSSAVETEKAKPLRKLKKFEASRKKVKRLGSGKVGQRKEAAEGSTTDPPTANISKLNLWNVPVRKSCRPRVVSKKYSVWSSTSMDSLSVESLGLKKLKKASTELGKKLNVKELTVLQYEYLVQVVLAPASTLLKNSLNHEVLQELIQVLRRLSEEESCRAVLLSSQGSTFCQGIDINQIISCSSGEKKTKVTQLVSDIREFVQCLSEFKKPLIAGVHGAAVGLGVTLLPYCDLVISSDKASFYTPYVKMGQAPEGAPTHTFPRISRHLVIELLLKSHKMTAADALKHGLVTQIIPEDRFEEDLILTARNVASQPIQGIRSIKYLLKSSDPKEMAGILRAEGELLEEHWNSTECLNNMLKFFNSGELQLKQLDNT